MGNAGMAATTSGFASWFWFECHLNWSCDQVWWLEKQTHRLSEHRSMLNVLDIHRGQSAPREPAVINRRRRSKHNNTDNWNLQGSNNWPLDDTQRFIIEAEVLHLIIVTKGVAVHISSDQTGFSNTTEGALVSRYSFIFAVCSSGEECFHVIDLLMLYLPGTWAQMSVPLWNPLLLLTSGTCNETKRLLKLQL